MSVENIDLLDIDADSVCRVCMSSSSQLQNLFSSTILDGYIVPFREMVKYCLDIIIDPLDNLPGKLCSVCKTDLCKFHLLKQKSKRTDDILTGNNFDLLDIDADSVCRVCLSSSSQLQNLFSSTILDGYIVSIPEMVKFCLDIIVEPLDKLPGKLCSVCKTDLSKFHLLKQKSKRTDVILTQAFKKVKSIEPKQECVLDNKSQNDSPSIVDDCETNADNDENDCEIHPNDDNDSESKIIELLSASSPADGQFPDSDEDVEVEDKRFIIKSPIIEDKIKQRLKRSISPILQNDKKIKVEKVTAKVELEAESIHGRDDDDHNASLSEILSQLNDDDDDGDVQSDQHTNSFISTATSRHRLKRKISPIIHNAKMIKFDEITAKVENEAERIHDSDDDGGNANLIEILLQSNDDDEGDVQSENDQHVNSFISTATRKHKLKRKISPINDKVDEIDAKVELEVESIHDSDNDDNANLIEILSQSNDDDEGDLQTDPDVNSLVSTPTNYRKIPSIIRKRKISPIIQKDKTINKVTVKDELEAESIHDSDNDDNANLIEILSQSNDDNDEGDVQSDQHEISFNPTETSNIEQQINEPLTIEENCKTCLKFLRLQDKYENHRCRPHRGTNNCNICQKNLIHEKLFQIHQEEFHFVIEANEDQELINENDEEEADSVLQEICENDNEDYVDVKLRPNSVNSIASTSPSVHSLNANYECFICHELFLNKNDYIDHCKSHNLTCIDCQIDFQSSVDLSKHMKNVHRIKQEKIEGNSDVDEQNDDNNQIDDTVINLCTICTKPIRGLQQFQHHLRVHESLTIVQNSIDYSCCVQCQMVFASKDFYDLHMEKHESINDCTDYQCLDDDNENELQCGICKENRIGLTAMKSHIITHMTEFLCPYDNCGSQYNGMAYLTTHILNKHLTDNGYLCKHCTVTFDSFEKLQIHLKNDCFGKKFACNHCEKKFFSSKALKLHLETIKGKKITCSFCKKKFGQKGELKIHLRSHTGERPFVCTVCGNAYKTSSMRASHMDSHIPEKTFVCEICDKKLQSRISYRNHLKRHTEEKKHACTQCGKKFFTKFHTKLHASRVHRDK